MTPQMVVFAATLTALVGIGVGYFLRWIISVGQRGSMELKVKTILIEARDEAKKITTEATDKAEKLLFDTRKEIKEREDGLKKNEERLIKKDDLLDNRQRDIDRETDITKKRIEEMRKMKERGEEILKEREEVLRNVAQLTEEEARNLLLAQIETAYQEDFLVRMNKLEKQGSKEMEKRAKDILSTTIHRLANDLPSDIMATTVSIASDEIKGKIIGKEGRNIKALERETGVEIIIDDTPGVITLSSFDPIRRQVARVALENLILDGRIQPAKIEDEVKKAKGEINKTIKEQGEKAAFEVGVFNLDPRIISILGRLHFRTSYGQNVLEHSVEMAHIAGMLAEELGADISIAKAGALLHDIGKAIDHEVTGTHVEIGRRILQKFGANEEVIKAMQAHHGDYPFETIESVIVQVADAISGSRPGARRDTVENYLKRLAELEAIANSFEGVSKSYALQAGREIRIFVTSEQVSDIQSKHIARQIALRIENELRYPGEIKISVIRETRIIEFAR